MPTKAELEAATNAVQRANANFIPNWALATIMARAALVAAEAVREADERGHYHQLRDAFADQRMTQTHAPLGGITATEQPARASVPACDCEACQGSQPADTSEWPVSPEEILAAAAAMASVKKLGCNESVTEVAIIALQAAARVRQAKSNASQREADEAARNLRPTNGPHLAGTQPPRKDYHTSGIPGDGDEERMTIRTAAEIEAERLAWKAAVAAGR